MKKSVVLFICFIGAFSSVSHAGSTFDASTNVLTIDSVTVPGDGTYYDIVVRLNNFDVLSVGNYESATASVKETCTRENFTLGSAQK